MNLLALDTSTSSTVLGLSKGGIVIDRTVRDIRTHSREVLRSIAALLAEAELTLGCLDGIVFGRGPGSFTGLRIAVGVVQGLAYGAGLPVIPVSSMAALAQSRAIHKGRIFVALSARLEEVYYGAYQQKNGVAIASSVEGVKDVSDLDVEVVGEWHLVTDAPHLQAILSRSLGVSFSTVCAETVPTVESLLTLGLHRQAEGDSISPLDASPVYLREQVVKR